MGSLERIKWIPDHGQKLPFLRGVLCCEVRVPDGVMPNDRDKRQKGSNFNAKQRFEECGGYAYTLGL